MTGESQYSVTQGPIRRPQESIPAHEALWLSTLVPDDSKPGGSTF